MQALEPCTYSLIVFVDSVSIMRQHEIVYQLHVDKFSTQHPNKASRQISLGFDVILFSNAIFIFK